jgi:hypothetical protein
VRKKLNILIVSLELDVVMHPDSFFFDSNHFALPSWKQATHLLSYHSTTCATIFDVHWKARRSYFIQ